jgi:pyruvate dehydrogenase (quinone)/pyruvate oxidase
MARSTAGDILIDSLIDWGVDTVFGLPGDSINGIIEALRIRQDRVRFIQVCHEEAAAFNACALRQMDRKARRVSRDLRPWRRYSVGRWIDTDGDGRYDVLEIETRGLKGPRTYEGTGMPFHEDGQTVVKESIYLDKADPDADHDVPPRGLLLYCGK